MCLGLSTWQGYECANAVPSASFLISLGEMRWPAAPSKGAPGSAYHGGWLCRLYQVPLILVMSGMHHAGVFPSTMSPACQEWRPHALHALPHAGSAALWHLAPACVCPPPRRGFGVLVQQVSCRVLAWGCSVLWEMGWCWQDLALGCAIPCC